MARPIIPAAKDFEALATITGQPGIGKVMVGKDLRLYREAKGLLEMIVPCEPREDTKPGSWYNTLHRDDYPAIEELAHLYDIFLSKYDREVMFVVGKLYGQPGFLYMVPKQEGTEASIKWEDKKGMDWFARQARFLGTVHVHPGDSCQPSGTDLTHWKEKSCSGIHMIFGRDQSFTMHASVAGHAIFAEEGTIKGIERTPVRLTTGNNRRLEDLLLQPKPVVMPGFNFGNKQWWGHQNMSKRALRRFRKSLQRNNKKWSTTGTDDLFDWDEWFQEQGDIIRQNNHGIMDVVSECLMESKGICVKLTDDGTIAGLRLVVHEGHAWMMTEAQYARYAKLTDNWGVTGAPEGTPIAFKTKQTSKKEDS